MERLDDEMKRLSDLLKAPNITDEEKKKLESLKKKREEVLAPMYHQVAVQFAGRSSQCKTISDC